MAVEFNNETHDQRAALAYAQIQAEKKSTGIEQWLLDKGIAKTPQQAKVIMIATIIVCFGITLFVYLKPAAPSELSKEKERQIMEYAKNAGTY
jgi:hypothetical protein